MMALRSYFKRLPIQRKISLAILVTCGTALAVTAVAIFLAQLVTFRQSFTRDLEAIGGMIGNNSTAALTFNDKKAAEEIVSAVKAKSHILKAAIELPDGSEFAAFTGRRLAAAAQPPKADGFHFVGPYLMLNQPIMLDGQRIGTLHLVSNYQAEYRRSLQLYAAILAAVLLVSILLALALANRLQKLIAAPILGLASTAQSVAAKKDYSLRAQTAAQDEVGQLTDAINEMLETIQNHATALQESRQRYEVAVMGSSDGLWDWDLVRQEYYYSPRWKSMIGYSESELGNSREAWESRLHPDDLDHVLRSVEDYLAGRVNSFEIEFRFQHKDGSYRWILSRGAALRDKQGRPLRFAGSHTDITARRHTEQEVEKLHKELVLTSRQAGMAEVATGVLHNVGNVLNSVNVSVNVINDQLGHSQVGSLAKVSALFDSHRADLGTFVVSDPKGRRLPEFLSHLAVALEEERAQVVGEMQTLYRNVEHLKEIVAMQQSYAKVAGITEDLPAASLVEDALRMNEGSFVRHGITVKREFGAVPLVRVDKHKVLQILVNLFRNAKYAMEAATGRNDKVLTLRLGMNGSGRVKVTVGDNGIGIAPENLTRIFGHGFTTKKDGHGFGLHSGALAAKEIGGSLQAFSDGPDTGATFILELPIAESNTSADNGSAHERGT